MKNTRSKKKEKSVSKLVKELDAVFSRYVRLKYADKDGFVACYTCGHRNHWKKMHCGHYISRFYKATRWDEKNNMPQCPMCNLWKRGDPVTFRQKLVAEYGETAITEMENSRKTLTKLDKDQLKAQIASFSDKL